MFNNIKQRVLFANIKAKLCAIAFIVLLFCAAYAQYPPIKTSFAQYGYSFMMDSGVIAENSILVNVSLSSFLEAGSLNGKTFTDAPAMRDFYDMNGNMPMWIGQSGIHPRLDSIVSILEDAWSHGLNPEQYHVSEISRLLDHPMQSQQAELELLISDAVIRYGQDMTAMRITPDSVDQKAKYWSNPLLGIDILQMLRYESSPGEVLEGLAPDNKLYSMLRDELIRLVGEEKDDDAPLIDFDGKLFKPGKFHRNVLKLRLSLGVEYNQDYGSEEKYDDALASAVMNFQRAHEIKTDGVIGPNTLSLLNLSREDKIYQIIANMERLRWQDKEKPDRYVLVNIPSATLWAVDNNEVKIEMPVVVGSSYRPTRSFKTEITGVRFNPTWTVPLSIKMADFLPKLKNDPSYLIDKGIEMIKGYGKSRETLDPYSIDWNEMTWKKMSKIRMVQSPGDHNALGRIRILMKNPYSIYLHDTNHKELFSRTGRTFSSGCIRMSRPDDVARFVLKNKDDWSDKKMKKVIRAKDTADIESEAIPVYILYQTTWLDDKQRLVFGRDVYKLDTKLVEELKTLGEVYIPESLPENVVRSADVSTLDLDH